MTESEYIEETFHDIPLEQFGKSIAAFPCNVLQPCLEVDVFDQAGKRYAPREWFIAPLPIIEGAIELIISGEIVNFDYDNEAKLIVRKDVT